MAGKYGDDPTDGSIAQGLNSGDTEGQPISYTNDGDKRRLDVAASVTTEAPSISISDNPTVIADDPDINLTTSSNPHDVVYSYSGSGELYGFTFELSNRNVEVRLVIDGTEVFNLNCKILGEMFITSTDSSIFSWVTYDRNYDLFHFKPRTPFSYATSVSLEARANNGNTGRYLGRYFVELTKVT